MNRFTRWLITQINKQGIGNKELAGHIKVTGASVGNWKKGTIPDGESLIALGVYFKHDPVDLFRMAYNLPDKGSSEVPLSGSEQDLVDWFRTLPNEEVKERVFHFLEKLPPDNPLILGGWGPMKTV